MIETRRSTDGARTALVKATVVAKATAKTDVELLKLATVIRSHKATARALKGILLRDSHFLFERASELFAPHPWAVDADGELLGHLLTVDDEAFAHAMQEAMVEVLTIPEAFDRCWADLEQRSAWVATYAHALRAMAATEEARDYTVCEKARLAEELAAVTAGLPDRNKRGGI